MAELRCPKCGKLNSDTREDCQYCGARLRPLVLPMTGELNLPDDWVKTPPPAAPAKPPAPVKPASGATDWLSDLRSGTAREESQPGLESIEKVTGAASVDDWLSKLQAQDQGSGTPGDSAGSDWMNTLRAPAEEGPSWLEQVSKPDPGQAGADLPDWMKSGGSSDETLVAKPRPQAPTPPAPEPSAELPWMSAAAETPLPDWLAGPSEPSVPDWMKTAAADNDQTFVGQPPAAPQAPEPAAPSSDLPDWLTGSAAVSASPPPAAEQPAAPSSDLPDWLTSSGASSDETPIARPAASQPAAPSNDLPDWLTGSAPAAEVPPAAPQPAAPEPAAGLPDWLTSSSASSDETLAARPAAPQPAAPANDLPDWLTAKGSSDETVVARAAAPKPAESSPALPDWLRTSGSSDETVVAAPRAKQPPQSELPSWLAASGGSPDDTLAAEPPAAVPAAPAADLPDWLSSGSDDTVAAPPPAVPAAQAASDLPDWLTPAPTPAAPAAPPELPAAKPGSDRAVEGITEWLAADSGAPVPGVPAGGESSKTPLTTTGWLRSLSPSDSGDDMNWLSTPKDTTPAPEPADLPDWLKGESAPPPPTIAPPSPSASPAVTTKLDELPDWLNDDLASAKPAGQEAAGPKAVQGITDWLNSEGGAPVPPPPAEEPGSPHAVEGITEWLASDSGGPMPGVPASASKTPLTTTGWLRSISGEQGADSMDWLGNAPAGQTEPAETPKAPEAPAAKPVVPAADSAEPSRAVEGITDWLATGSKEPVPGTGPIAEDGSGRPLTTTGWLRSITPSESGDDMDWLNKAPDAPKSPAAVPAASSASSDLPDWLKAEPAQPAAPATPAASSDLPDWLKSESPAPEAPAAKPVVPAADSAEPRALEGITDWLATGSKEPVPGTGPIAEDGSNRPLTTTGWLRSVTPSESGDDMDWLSNAPDARTAATAAGPASSSSDLPDWLKPAPAQPAPASPAAAPAASAAPSDFPDWLKSEPAQPAAPIPTAPAASTDLPDWLKSESPAATAPDTPPAKPVVPVADATEARALEGITDWLASGSKEPVPGTGPIAEDGSNRPLTTTGWLRSVTPSDSGDSLDWLNDAPDAKSAAPAAARPAQPAPAAPPSKPVVPVDSSHALEGITDWLAGESKDAPPGTGPIAEDGSNRPLTTTGWLRSLSPAGSTDSLDWLSNQPPAPPQTGAAPTPDADVPDWLRDAAPAQAAPPSTGGAPASNDAVKGVTDWMGGSGSNAPAAPASPGKSLSETTDWLNSLGAGPQSAPAPAQPAAGSRKGRTGWLTGPLKPQADQPAPAEKAPKAVLGATDWLDTLAASAPVKPPTGALPPETAAPAQGAELPDWLGGTAPTGTGDLPDWASGSAASSPAAADETKSGKAVIGTTDWLKTVISSDKPASTPAFVDTAMLGDVRKNDVSDLDWLLALQPTSPSAAPQRNTGPLGSGPLKAPRGTGPIQPAGAEPAPAAPQSTPQTGELPSWLAALKPTGLDLPASDADATLIAHSPLASTGAGAPPAQPAPARPESAPVSPAPSSTAETMVARGGIAPLVSSVPPVAVPAFTTSDLSAAPLPGWMQALRPLDARATAREPEPDREETAGPLAGMRGILPAESVISIAGKPGAAVVGFVLTDAHTRQADHLRQLVQEEGTEDVEVKPQRRTRINFNAWRLLVAAILFIVTLAPFNSYVNKQLQGLFVTPAVSADVSAFAARVGSLQAEQPVLVAIDYEPANRGEMDPAVSAVLVHLLKRNLWVLTVSTSPSGAGIADDLLNAAAVEVGAKKPNEDYENLGYIPGGPAGLRQFAQAPVAAFPYDFAGSRQPFGKFPGFNSLRNFQMVVVASATADDLQNWIQQVQPSMGAGQPLTGVVSAAAAPLAQPYRGGSTPQLSGLVSGLSGALQYNAQTQRDPAQAVKLSANWLSLGIGLYVAVGVIGIGTLVSLVSLVLARRPQPKKKGAKVRSRTTTVRAAAPAAEPEPATVPAPEPVDAGGAWDPEATAVALAPKPAKQPAKPVKSAKNGKNGKSAKPVKKAPAKGKAPAPAAAKGRTRPQNLETRVAAQGEPEPESKPARPRMRKV